MLLSRKEHLTAPSEIIYTLHRAQLQLPLQQRERVPHLPDAAELVGLRREPCLNGSKFLALRQAHEEVTLRVTLEAHNDRCSFLSYYYCASLQRRRLFHRSKRTMRGLQCLVNGLQARIISHDH